MKDEPYLSVASSFTHSRAESSCPPKGHISYHPAIRALQRFVPRTVPFLSVGFRSFAYVLFMGDSHSWEALEFLCQQGANLMAVDLVGILSLCI